MVQEWPQPDVMNALLDYILNQKELPASLNGRSKPAFKNALRQAFERFKREHPEQAADLLNISFLEYLREKSIPSFWTSNNHPTLTELAAHWADSLNDNHPERQTTTRQMERASTDFFAYFLEALQQTLQQDEKLRTFQTTLAQPFQLLTQETNTLRQKLDADLSTAGTRRDYLKWMIGRTIYVDSPKQVPDAASEPVKLEEIYVPLRIQRRERVSSADRRRQEQELAELQERIAHSSVPDEEAEEELEQLLARLVGERVEVPEAVNRYDRLVILGDPGSGKTTLLRYLALRHAQAVANGQTEAGDGLGTARFPILMRIAAYAENAVWKTPSLSEFLVDYCRTLQCPEAGLADLLETELAAGNCLILLDGLDEIVNLEDRQVVAEQVEQFVQEHHHHSNRFIITSRSTGYHSVLPRDSFIHYTIQEMDEAQIRRFLEQWYPTVDDQRYEFLIEDLSISSQEKVDRRRKLVEKQEIDAMMRAVLTLPGVRRLATNPLLLRTMALITMSYTHSTTENLPQKRIELYRRAADTLTPTWWTKRDAHEPAGILAKDWYLTPLLSKMAYWLHAHKPTGIATEHEVYEVLGEEWARLNGQHWDKNTPNPRITAEISKFLAVVRECSEAKDSGTGVFVERPPEGYSFLHLAFQEYYAARYLVARSDKRVALIRTHLHDPRWTEPILLALGFVGLGSPLEASKLLETTILAQGEDAKACGFTASPYEDLLGRDYLFALRCLGDDIPTSPALVRKLTDRLVDELLDQIDSARFSRYRQALQERLAYLKGSHEASLLLWELITTLKDDRYDHTTRYRAAESLGELGEASSEVVKVLLTALSDVYIREAAARSLGKLRKPFPEVISALIRTLHLTVPPERNTIAETLKQLGQIFPDQVTRTLHDDLDQRFSLGSSTIAEILRQLGQTSPDTTQVMTEVWLKGLSDSRSDIRITSEKNLVKLVRSSAQTVELTTKLLKVLQSSNSQMSSAGARILGELPQPSSEVIAALITVLSRDRHGMSEAAAWSLGKLHQAPPEVVTALLNALKSRHLSVREAVVKSLGELGYPSPEVIAALTSRFDSQNRDGASVRRAAVKSLGKLDYSSHEVIHALIPALFDDDWKVRVEAARSLGRLGQGFPSAVGALIRSLYDDTNGDVRATTVESLVQLGRTSPPWITQPLELLQDDIPTGPLTARPSGPLRRMSPAIIQELRQALRDKEPIVHLAAAKNLIKLGLTDSAMQNVLLEDLRHAEDWYRRRSTLLLGQASQNDETIIRRLWDGLRDTNHAVRMACAQALAQLGRRFPNARESIASLLVQAIEAAEFAVPDDINRLAHDYAYDGLWMLLVGGAFEEV